MLQWRRNLINNSAVPGSATHDAARTVRYTSWNTLLSGWRISFFDDHTATRMVAQARRTSATRTQAFSKVASSFWTASISGLTAVGPKSNFNFAALKSSGSGREPPNARAFR